MQAFEDGLADALLSGLPLSEAIGQGVANAKLLAATEQALSLDKDQTDQAMSSLSSGGLDPELLDDPTIGDAILDAIASGESIIDALDQSLDTTPQTEQEVPDSTQRSLALGGNIDSALSSGVELVGLTPEELKIVLKVFEDTLFENIVASIAPDVAMDNAITAAQEMKTRVLSVRMQQTANDSIGISAAHGFALTNDELKYLIRQIAVDQ